MSITITLSDSHIEQYIKVLEMEIREQEIDIIALQDKLDANLELLSTLKAKISTDIISKHVIGDRLSPETYDHSWPVTRKAEYILQITNYPLAVREICIALDKIDPDAKGEKDIRGFNTVLAATLGNYVKFGNTFGRCSENGIYKYGLKDWFKPNGDLKDEYNKKEN